MPYHTYTGAYFWFLRHKATGSIFTPPMDGMLVHRRVQVPRELNSPVVIYTPGWREAL